MLLRHSWARRRSRAKKGRRRRGVGLEFHITWSLTLHVVQNPQRPIAAAHCVSLGPDVAEEVPRSANVTEGHDRHAIVTSGFRVTRAPGIAQQRRHLFEPTTSKGAFSASTHDWSAMRAAPYRKDLVFATPCGRSCSFLTCGSDQFLRNAPSSRLFRTRHTGPEAFRP